MFYMYDISDYGVRIFPLCLPEEGKGFRRLHIQDTPSSPHLGVLSGGVISPGRSVDLCPLG